VQRPVGDHDPVGVDALPFGQQSPQPWQAGAVAVLQGLGGAGVVAQPAGQGIGQVGHRKGLGGRPPAEQPDHVLARALSHNGERRRRGQRGDAAGNQRLRILDRCGWV
jgi:hypothetical protein